MEHFVQRARGHEPSVSVPIRISIGVVLGSCRLRDEVKQLKPAAMFVSKVDEVDFAHSENDEDDFPGFHNITKDVVSP